MEEQEGHRLDPLYLTSAFWESLSTGSSQMRDSCLVHTIDIAARVSMIACDPTYNPASDCYFPVDERHGQRCVPVDGLLTPLLKIENCLIETFAGCVPFHLLPAGNFFLYAGPFGSIVNGNPSAESDFDLVLGLVTPVKLGEFVPFAAPSGTKKLFDILSGIIRTNAGGIIAKLNMDLAQFPGLTGIKREIDVLILSMYAINGVVRPKTVIPTDVRLCKI